MKNSPVEPLDNMIAVTQARVAVDLRAYHANAPADSPIESMLATALYAQTAYRTRTQFPIRFVTCADGKHGPAEGVDHAMVCIASQVRVLDWLVDYTIWAHDGGSWRRLIIECDGHDFHERTKEQAIRDRERDRRLQQHGETIFRFTGSEIWNNAIGCADQVLRWVDRVHSNAVELVTQ